MGSKIALKNAQDQEFSINHLDNAGAIAINSNDIAKQSEIETYIAPFHRGMKNLLINGNFDVWQRGVSFSAVGFTADRWYSMYANTVTKSIVDGKNTLNIACAGLALGLRYRAENTSLFSGKTLTFSLTAKYLTAATNLRFIISFYDNSGVLISSLTASNRTVGTSLSRYSYTFTCPDLSAYNSNASFMQIQIDAGGIVTDTLSIQEVQLEEGSVASPFELRPYGLDEMLCKRYFEKGAMNNTVRRYAASLLDGYEITTLLYKVSKRANPTVIASGVTYTNCSLLSSFGDADYISFYVRASAAGVYSAAFTWTSESEL